MNTEVAAVPSLSALASAIIPADERDGGAACVDAGARLAEKLAGGPTAGLYRSGLERAVCLAEQRFAKTVDKLPPHEIHELIAQLRTEFPAFYKQLRLDVAAMYLSDPAVWQRIEIGRASCRERV